MGAGRREFYGFVGIAPLHPTSFGSYGLPVPAMVIRHEASDRSPGRHVSPARRSSPGPTVVFADGRELGRRFVADDLSRRHRDQVVRRFNLQPMIQIPDDIA